jgi:hypothetical protein
MAVTVQPPLPGKAHRNHGLFSDHYLDETLPTRDDWRRLVEEAAPVMARLGALLEGYEPGDGEKEAETEEGWVRPVLREMGHDVFATQPSLAVPGGTQEPDYVFYREAAARDADKGRTLHEGRLSGRAYAVGDAKRWDRPLDIPLKEGKRIFGNQNPSYQIFFYMQHSGMEWGILTNGRLWRLYHRASAYKLDRYYEVDLPALIEAGDAEAFACFFAFFRREAFEGGRSGMRRSCGPPTTTLAASRIRSRRRFTKPCATSPRASLTTRRTALRPTPSRSRRSTIIP